MDTIYHLRAKPYQIRLEFVKSLRIHSSLEAVLQRKGDDFSLKYQVSIEGSDV